MTQPQSLNVEYQELMARADELEAPIPGLPLSDPQAPSALPMVINAAQQLGYSAENLRYYLRAGEDVRKDLAASLRNAAMAYEEVDEEAGQALNVDFSSESAPKIGPRVGAAAKADSPADRSMAAVLPGGPLKSEVGTPDTRPGEGVWWNDYVIEEWVDYYDIKRAAYAIAQYDQGIDVGNFTKEWQDHRVALMEALDRFRPFRYWEGAAADAVEANFDQQRTWTNSMAQLCDQLSVQARGIALTQPWANDEHPDYESVVFWEEQWRKGSPDPYIRQGYTDAVQKSEAVLTEYQRRAGLPLTPVNATKPPRAYNIDPPADPSASGTGADTTGGLGSDLGVPADSQIPDLPTAPSAGGPAAPDAGALAGTGDVPGAPMPTGSGVKAASLGGGGLGGGVPSVPATPLQPSTDAGAAPRAAAAGPGAVVGSGRGVPGVGGGMGGMPLGGAPGGGQGGDSKKSKRTQEEDEAIYTEDRSWTESIIGIRMRKEPPGQ